MVKLELYNKELYFQLCVDFFLSDITFLTSELSSKQQPHRVPPEVLRVDKVTGPKWRKLTVTTHNRCHQYLGTPPPAPLTVFKYTPPLKKRSGALNFGATGMIWENDVMYPKHTSNRPADHCCATRLD